MERERDNDEGEGFYTPIILYLPVFHRVCACKIT